MVKQMILGIQFSYDKKLDRLKNLCKLMAKIETI